MGVGWITGFIPCLGKKSLLYINRPNWPRGPVSLLFGGHHGCFPGGKAAGVWSYSVECWSLEWVELYLHSSVCIVPCTVTLAVTTDGSKCVSCSSYLTVVTWAEVMVHEITLTLWRTKHSLSHIKKKNLMLFVELLAVCSENHTERKTTLLIVNHVLQAVR